MSINISQKQNYIPHGYMFINSVVSSDRKCNYFYSNVEGFYKSLIREEYVSNHMFINDNVFGLEYSEVIYKDIIHIDQYKYYL